jgi:hypothetical protein
MQGGNCDTRYEAAELKRIPFRDRKIIEILVLHKRIPMDLSLPWSASNLPLRNQMHKWQFEEMKSALCFIIMQDGVSLTPPEGKSRLQGSLCSPIRTSKTFTHSSWRRYLRNGKTVEKQEEMFIYRTQCKGDGWCRSNTQEPQVHGLRADWPLRNASRI